MTASKDVLIEYNKLRARGRKDWQLFNIPKSNKSKKVRRINGSTLEVGKNVEEIQEVCTKFISAIWFFWYLKKW